MGSNVSDSKYHEKKGKALYRREEMYGPRMSKKFSEARKRIGRKHDTEEKDVLNIFQQSEQLEHMEQAGNEGEEELEFIQQSLEVEPDARAPGEDVVDLGKNDLELMETVGEVYRVSVGDNTGKMVPKTQYGTDDTEQAGNDEEEELEFIQQSLEVEPDARAPGEDAVDLGKNDLELMETVGEVYRVSVGKKAGKASDRSQQAIDEVNPYKYGKRIIAENRLRYMDGRLHMFKEKYWKFLDDDTLRQLVYESLEEPIKSATKNIESLVANIAHFVKREILKSYNNGTNRFTGKEEQAIENRIVFENCVFDVKTGKQLPFTHKLPYNYMVSCDYIKEDLPTPYYDKFKYDATGGDPDSMEMFDLMQAYLLTPNRKGKCFFIMAYAKDSGKTSFGEFIEKYFQEGTIQKVDVEHLGGKFSYAGMERALLVTCLEMPITRLTKSAVKAFKNFTGESRIEIEAKYQNRITSNVRFKILLGSNGGIYLPPGDSDEAFYRRAIVIPFIHSAPLDQLIADMPQRWEDERSAIISKCVRKLGKIINGDGGIVFPESELSKRIKYGWQGKNLINENFVRKAINFTAKSEDAIPKEDLKAEYDRYYSENVSGMGTASTMQCTKDELVRLLFTLYPHVGSRRLRRRTLEDKEPRLQHCITGIVWADGFGDKKKRSG